MIQGDGTKHHAHQAGGRSGSANVSVRSGQRAWTSYFDYIVVDANKPRFFMEGNTLREVDTVCNSLLFTCISTSEQLYLALIA